MGSAAELRNGASSISELAPVRLDMKLMGKEIRESFCLDASLDDRALGHLSRSICHDLDVPRQCEFPVMSAIRRQLDAFLAAEQASPQPGHERLEAIKLDFNIGKIHVKDQFVWDVGDPGATPEEFAKVTCKDLKLPSSCIPEIAYQIREQVLQLKKAGKKGSVPPLILDGPVIRKPSTRRSTAQHVDTKPKNSLKEREGFVAGRKGVYLSGVVRKRAEVEEWCPQVTELTDKEVKQAKRARQQGNAGNTALATASGVTQSIPGNQRPEGNAPKRARQRNRGSRSKPKHEADSAQATSTPFGTPLSAGLQLPFTQMVPSTASNVSIWPQAPELQIQQPSIRPMVPTPSANIPNLPHVMAGREPKSMPSGVQHQQNGAQSMAGDFATLMPDGRQTTKPLTIDQLWQVQLLQRQQQQVQQQRAQQQSQHIQQQRAHHHHYQQRHPLRMMMGGVGVPGPAGAVPHPVGVGNVPGGPVATPQSGDQHDPYAVFRFGCYEPMRYR